LCGDDSADGEELPKGLIGSSVPVESPGDGLRFRDVRRCDEQAQQDARHEKTVSAGVGHTTLTIANDGLGTTNVVTSTV
jgi:hypothetical protein